MKGRGLNRLFIFGAWSLSLLRAIARVEGNISRPLRFVRAEAAGGSAGELATPPVALTPSSILVGLVMALALALSPGSAKAQNPSQIVPLTVGQTERGIAHDVSEYWYHILPASTDAAKGASFDGPVSASSLANSSRSDITSFAVPKRFFPSDVTKINPGAALVTSANLDNVYVLSTHDTPWA